MEKQQPKRLGWLSAVYISSFKQINKEFNFIERCSFCEKESHISSPNKWIILFSCWLRLSFHSMESISLEIELCIDSIEAKHLGQQISMTTNHLKHIYVYAICIQLTVQRKWITKNHFVFSICDERSWISLNCIFLHIY